MHDDIPLNAERMPIVRVIEGEALVDSRDVAAYFGKQHKNVLRDLRNLHCSDDFRRLNFEPIQINDLTGSTTSHVMMTKDGFLFLVLGFGGDTAGKLKEAYISQFNAMEADLRRQPAFDPSAVLSDPAAMRGLLLTYTEKVISLQAEVAEMQPKIEAHDRLTEAYGSFCRQTAAKNLGAPPMTLIRWMRTNGWTFRRPGDKDDLAYQSKIAAGLLEHKVTTGMRPDGSEWTSTQVRVTAKGMVALAKVFLPSVRAA